MHLVLVSLPLPDGESGDDDEQDAIMELEQALQGAIEASGTGEFDGDEFGGGECLLYLYGPDADALFAAIEPVLVRSPLAARGHAMKRYGDAGEPAVREARVTWPSHHPQ